MRCGLLILLIIQVWTVFGGHYYDYGRRHCLMPFKGKNQCRPIGVDKSKGTKSTCPVSFLSVNPSRRYHVPATKPFITHLFKNYFKITNKAMANKYNQLYVEIFDKSMAVSEKQEHYQIDKFGLYNFWTMRFYITHKKLHQQEGKGFVINFLDSAFNVHWNVPIDEYNERPTKTQKNEEDDQSAEDGKAGEQRNQPAEDGEAGERRLLSGDDEDSEDGEYDEDDVDDDDEVDYTDMSMADLIETDDTKKKNNPHKFLLNWNTHIVNDNSFLGPYGDDIIEIVVADKKTFHNEIKKCEDLNDPYGKIHNLDRLWDKTFDQSKGDTNAFCVDEGTPEMVKSFGTCDNEALKTIEETLRGEGWNHCSHIVLCKNGIIPLSLDSGDGTYQVCVRKFNSHGTSSEWETLMHIKGFMEINNKFNVKFRKQENWQRDEDFMKGDYCIQKSFPLQMECSHQTTTSAEVFERDVDQYPWFACPFARDADEYQMRFVPKRHIQISGRFLCSDFGKKSPLMLLKNKDGKNFMCCFNNNVAYKDGKYFSKTQGQSASYTKDEFDKIQDYFTYNVHEFFDPEKASRKKQTKEEEEKVGITSKDDPDKGEDHKAHPFGHDSIVNGTKMSHYSFADVKGKAPKDFPNEHTRKAAVDWRMAHGGYKEYHTAMNTKITEKEYLAIRATEAPIEHPANPDEQKTEKQKEKEEKEKEENEDSPANSRYTYNGIYQFMISSIITLILLGIPAYYLVVYKLQ